MAQFGNWFQKALYLGLGLADYAGERAGSTVQQLRAKSQQLAEELVARGEMSSEEARQFVNDILNNTQPRANGESSAADAATGPQRIEILADGEADPGPSQTEDIDTLRQQVEALQQELRRLKRQ